MAIAAAAVAITIRNWKKMEIKFNNNMGKFSKVLCLGCNASEPSIQFLYFTIILCGEFETIKLIVIKEKQNRETNTNKKPKTTRNCCKISNCLFIHPVMVTNCYCV